MDKNLEKIGKISSPGRIRKWSSSPLGTSIQWKEVMNLVGNYTKQIEIIQVHTHTHTPNQA